MGRLTCKHCGWVFQAGDDQPEAQIEDPNCIGCIARQPIQVFNSATQEHDLIDSKCKVCGCDTVLTGDELCFTCRQKAREQMGIDALKYVSKVFQGRKPKFDRRLKDAISTLSATLASRGEGINDPFAVLNRWSELNKLTVRENCTSIIMLKIARIDNNISVEDSLLDIAGYAILAYALEKENANGSDVHKP